ncbi:6546_t:CDS:2 [Funneliformis geosporum]|uniref:19019_t:CDS:1 n=1 Tax=Funneliformis geosporum TaxID=1117311 RepID=A0A9W4SCK2_9GLOM|nr:6546_t:CDS:2 [Funneliformis geosporum]CAI2163661.1 19019_t:CDS:2 [Funneliformis geosporum]
MSITPNALKNKRKNELKDIALDLGLNTKGLRSELEERIRIHLESTEVNKNEEIEDPMDIPLSKATPRRSDRKKSRSRSRKDLKEISSHPNGDRHSSDEENQSASSESEIKVIKRETLLEETTRYPSNQLTFESSQQEVAVNATYRTPHTSEDSDIAEPSDTRGLPNDRIFRVNTIHDSLLQLRKNVSNAHTFCKAVICLEFAVFLYCAIEWNYEVTSISIPNFFDYESNEAYVYYIRVPDIFILLEWHRFWRPLISFIFYLLLLPLGFSYIINFEPQRHVYNPLVFSVFQYTIFLVSYGSFDWTEDVRDFIPDTLIYAGAGAGAIFALYEIILAN